MANYNLYLCTAIELKDEDDKTEPKVLMPMTEVIAKSVENAKIKVSRMPVMADNDPDKTLVLVCDPFRR